MRLDSRLTDKPVCSFPAHTMRLCEDPGSGQFGLGSVFSLQPTRKVAQEEDTRQTEGNKLFTGSFGVSNVLCKQHWEFMVAIHLRSSYSKCM